MEQERFTYSTTWARAAAIEAFGVCYLHEGAWSSPIVEALGARRVSGDPFAPSKVFPTEAAAVAHVRNAARDEATRESERIDALLDAAGMKVRLTLARNFSALRKREIGVLATESLLDHRRREYRKVLRNGVTPEIRRLPDLLRLPVVFPVGLPVHVVDTRGFPARPVEIREDRIARRQVVDVDGSRGTFDAVVRYELESTPGVLSYDLAALERGHLEGALPGFSVFLLDRFAQAHMEEFSEAVRRSLNGTPPLEARAPTPAEGDVEALLSAFPGTPAVEDVIERPAPMVALPAPVVDPEVPEGRELPLPVHVPEDRTDPVAGIEDGAVPIQVPETVPSVPDAIVPTAAPVGCPAPSEAAGAVPEPIHEETSEWDAALAQAAAEAMAIAASAARSEARAPDGDAPHAGAIETLGVESPEAVTPDATQADGAMQPAGGVAAVEEGRYDGTSSTDEEVVAAACDVDLYAFPEEAEPAVAEVQAIGEPAPDGLSDEPRAAAEPDASEVAILPDEARLAPARRGSRIGAALRSANPLRILRRGRAVPAVAAPAREPAEQAPLLALPAPPPVPAVVAEPAPPPGPRLLIGPPLLGEAAAEVPARRRPSLAPVESHLMRALDDALSGFVAETRGEPVRSLVPDAEAAAPVAAVAAGLWEGPGREVRIPEAAPSPVGEVPLPEAVDEPESPFPELAAFLARDGLVLIRPLGQAASDSLVLRSIPEIAPWLAPREEERDLAA